MFISENTAVLSGAVLAQPTLSHSGRSEVYYTFPLAVRRLSGTADTINVIVRQALMDDALIAEGMRIEVSGQVRSFNNRSGEGNKLVITLFARRILPAGEEDMNSIELVGAICKEPNLRFTPMGREICDLMLAVNRRYGRSDYLPCIAWGILARKASKWPVGTKVCISGRLQSRTYIKTIDGISSEKTAFEISCGEIDRVEDDFIPQPV